MRITEVLNELKIPYCSPGSHHHVGYGWLGVDCPWCPKPSGSKGKWRLGIEISSGRCNCWVCGGHSLQSVLTASAHVSPTEVYDLVGTVRLQKTTREPARGHLTPPSGVGPLDEPHRRWLRWRGFDSDKIERLWKIQGIGISIKFSWRIFIPIFLDNEVVSWTTRSIGRNGGYISAKSEQESVLHKRTLYGIDLARTTIIICEGPVDVWNVGPGAVATFGTMVSQAQVKMLTRFPRRIVCFDSDEAGKRRGKAVANLLSAFPGETLNVQLDAEDPGSASKEVICGLRKLAFGE